MHFLFNITFNPIVKISLMLNYEKIFHKIILIEFHASCALRLRTKKLNRHNVVIDTFHKSFVVKTPLHNIIR